MSDFHRELSQREHEIMARAIALDYEMWSVANPTDTWECVIVPGTPSLPPYNLGPEIWSRYSKGCYAAIVREVYYEGKTLRSLPSGFVRRFDEDLYDEEVRGPRSDEVREIASRLKISERHVRRRLRRLRAGDRIPTSWFVGCRWKAPVDEAVKALVEDGSTRPHSPHTKTIEDPDVLYVVRCRKEIARLRTDLENIRETRRICQRWHKLTRTVPVENLSAFRLELHFRREQRNAYNLMARLAAAKGWQFCELFIILYDALIHGNRTPVAYAKEQLRLPHAKFYRRFGQMVRQARLLAERRIAKPMLGDKVTLATHQPRDTDAALDVESAFDAWQEKVPESRLFL